MAPTSRPGVASSAPGEAQPRASNGVLTSSNTPAGTINRKKAKRRQKQAAKQNAAREALGAEYADDDDEDDDYANGDLSTTHNPPPSDTGYNSSYARGVMPADGQYGYDNEDERIFSDEDGAYPYNGIRGPPNPGTGKKSKRKKKNKNQQAVFSPPSGLPGSYPSPLPPPPPPAQMTRPSISEEALRTVQRRATKDAIWDTSSQEERLRIKEFWLNLEEEKRKSLVKIEKEAVLRKMKEQQKHSCSCTVCGRKRTAIEEELEVLYDAYYEELEQFANHGQQGAENGVSPAPAPAMSYRHSMSRGPPDRGHIANRKFSGRRIEELADDDEDYLDDDRDEEGSDQASYDDEYASTNTDDLPPDNTPANDFFSFGKSLTVKGGILTVADDLLKNDGQKFIDMMEQLAERRMQREEDAAMGSYRMPPPHQPMAGPHGTHPHAHLPPDEDDEYSDEEEDEEYDSQGEELEDDEDEMDTMTEEQRMEEGRRMFQIFAARMFEQRVLTAYREKVARDRQERLIAELDNEKDNDKERQAKKERDAQKKKLKKAQQKAAKDQKAQQKAEAEAKAKADEEARLAEQKRKREEQREEQRKKKEEERRKLEEEKARKEAEKQKRQLQERERQQEAERKAREAKAEEKRRKDEVRQKERQAREAKEREAKERREQAEHGKRMKEEQAKREAAMQDSITSTAAADSTRRAPQPPPPAAKVALPPGLLPPNSLSPPQPKVATPVAPKAPTPVKPRDASQPGGGVGGRRSTTASSESSSKQSTPQKRPQLPLPPISNVSVPGMSRAQPPPPPLHPAPPPHPGSLPFPHQAGVHSIAPPPGMPLPPNSSLPGFSPGPVSPFGIPSPMMAGMAPRAFSGPQTGMYGPNNHHTPPQQQQQQQQMNHRPGFGMPAPPGPPPGMGPPGMNRGYTEGAPASFVPHGPSVTSGFAPGQQSSAVPSHSRQASGSSPIGPPPGGAAAAAAPIGRPGAIKRPASVKTNGEGDVDDLSTHLGSSALLADDDEPLPSPGDGSRPGAPLGMPPGRTGFGDTPHQPGFGSAFNHGVSGFGGLGTRMPPADQSWAPRATGAPLQPPPNQFAAPTGLGGAGHNGWGSTAAPGAGSGAAAAGGGGGWGNAGNLNPSMHRASTSRPMIVRKLACEACHSLAAAKSGANGGYSDLAEVLHHVQQARVDLGIQRRELEDILDTEGDIDGHNGGGHFLRRANMITHVQPHGARGPGGLGEIGSPMIGASVPILPNLGRF